jgi:ankyrin repeat protein
VLTALIEAAINGDVVQVKKFLALAHDVNAVDVAGNTALHWACYHRNAELQKLLLSVRCDVNIANTANKHTALMWASIGGDVLVVHRLLKAGASLPAVDVNGYTALFHAVQNRHVTLVCYLVGQGAVVDGRDTEGHTPFLWVRTPIDCLQHVSFIDFSRSFSISGCLQWRRADASFAVASRFILSCSRQRRLDGTALDCRSWIR